MHKQDLPEPVLRVDSYTELFHAAREGLGAAMLSYAYTLRASSDLLPLALDVAPLPSLHLYMVTHKALRKLPRIAAIWEWIVESCEHLKAQ